MQRRPFDCPSRRGPGPVNHFGGFTLSLQKNKKSSPCEPCCGGETVHVWPSERTPPIMPPKKSKAYVPARACAHDDARLLRLLSRVPGVSCRVFFILARKLTEHACSLVQACEILASPCTHSGNSPCALMFSLRHARPNMCMSYRSREQSRHFSEHYG